MSLRQRLLVAVAAALFASVALGAWLTTWQMAHMVRAELTLSLRSARRSVAAALQDMAASPPEDALRRLVSGYDGNQHVLAELLRDGAIVAVSHPAPPGVAPPDWFSRLAAPHLAPQELAVPHGAIRLSALPGSEIGEHWIEAGRLVGLLALSAGLAAAFCFATAAWSLRPLRPLAEALTRLEQGQPEGPVAAAGPPEIVQLGAAFNRMQQEVTRAARENRQLSAQIETLAEEERTELARDLHDEIGPLLFALTAWAAALRLQTEAGNGGAAAASLTALEKTAAATQTALRDVLRRLRDSAPPAGDLAAGIDELIGFWRGIRPKIAFTADMPAEAAALPDALRAAFYRVAQEGISNAVRHGTPTRVRVACACTAGMATLVVENDRPDPGPAGAGLGLVGLEERLRALGGTLRIDRAADWRLTAAAPVPARAAGAPP